MKKCFLVIGALFMLFNTTKAQRAGVSKKEKSKVWVFIMAGQSNMAGRGKVEAEDTISDTRIFTLNKNNDWVLAKEPLHFYEPNLTGLDCGLSFAKEILKNAPSDVKIAIIPCAVGGSSIQQWLGDSTYRNVTLLTNFKEKAALAQTKGVIKGIIWHQGESNANDRDLPGYPAYMDALFSVFRKTSGFKKLPIILGEIGEFSPDPAKKALTQKMNETIHDFVKTRKNYSYIKTTDLNHKGDNLHFDSASQRKMGERYAGQYWELVKK